MLGLKRHTVKLIRYDNKWPAIFLQTKRQLNKVISKYIIDIQHVGSTAIKGIYSKPILDIAIAIKNKNDINKFKHKLEKISYEYRGDGKRDGGILFVKSSKPEVRTQHLHFVKINDTQWKNYINFRDHLNKNKKIALQYSKLKKELEKKYSNNRKAYTEAKNEFIDKILYNIKKGN
ncbi:MAG: GrpB family protein [bacterium]|nr:GrpB family protein [bacterium]